MTPELFVSAEKAADFLDISRRYLLALARKGIAGAYPLDGQAKRKVWVFRLSELADAIAKNADPETSDLRYDPAQPSVLVQEGDDMKRARLQRGSVVFDKRRKTWNFLWCENGHRRTKLLGAARELPTKTAALRAAEPLRRSVDKPPTGTGLIVADLVRQYRMEKMPTRVDTRRSYEVAEGTIFFPDGESPPSPSFRRVPLNCGRNPWISLQRAKRISGGCSASCGTLRCGAATCPCCAIPWISSRFGEPASARRNPGASRWRNSRNSLATLEEPFRLMALLCCCLGLRISECLALKWGDVDWINSKLTVERSIVCQQIDDVKTAESRKKLVIDRELLAALQGWKQTTRFSGPEDWVFASTVQAGELPWSYDQVWRKYQEAAKAAGIGGLGTHSLRHTYRTWLDSVGTPVGVQQKLMRHADIRTTMNVYGDAVPADIAQAHGKIVGLALNRLQT